MSNRVVFIWLFGPSRGRGGGPGAVIRNLMEGLSTKGTDWEASAIYPDLSQSPSVFTGAVFMFLSAFASGRAVRWYYLAQRLLRKEIRSQRPSIEEADIVHFHDIFSFWAGRALIRRFNSDARLVLSTHAPGSTSWEYRENVLREGKPMWLRVIFGYFRWVETNSFLDADMIIVPSKGAWGLIQRDLGLSSDRSPPVSVLHNGVLPMPAGKRSGLRKDFGLGHDDVLLLAIGRLVKEKGVDTFLETLHLIREDRPNVYGLIVGAGPEADYLFSLARKMELQGVVTFVEHIPHIRDAYAAADILVSCGRRSAFDLVILEAMSTGLPVVATAEGGNREALGGNPELLASGNPRDLMARIVALVDNARLRRNIGNRLRQRYKSNFTVDQLVDRALRLYTSARQPDIT